jgi:hypothetical protein
MLSKYIKHILEVEGSYFLKVSQRMISAKHYVAHFQKTPKTITETPHFIQSSLLEVPVFTVYEIKVELRKHDGYCSIFVFKNGKYFFCILEIKLIL